MQTEKGRAGYWILWCLIIAVAAYLRFWQVGMQIVIDDEWHAINELKSSGYLEILQSFGRADHSIPLTIYYKLIADSIGLTEWSLRLPMLICGLATVVAVPWLLRRRLMPLEQLATGALLAISPVLIHFSRTGRPYAITTLLCLLAMVAFYRWWQGRQRRWGVVYVASTSLAAWLHPLTLIFTFSSLLWAGLLGLQAVWQCRDYQSLVRVIWIGLLTVAICVALLLPPMVNDYASLAAKTGVHRVNFSTLVEAWLLFSGMGQGWLAILMLGLACLGGVELYRRDGSFANYLIFIIAVALLLVVLSGAEWIQHGRLLMRYMLPAVPIALLLCALGVTFLAVCLSVATWNRIIQGMVYSGLVTALFTLGPIPIIYQGVNQFTGHQSYQFSYDYQDNAYRQFLSVIEPPQIYQRIASLQLADSWDIVETPWRLESFYNPFPIYQRIHQLPIRVGFLSGLCAKPFYGEYGIHKDGLDFEYFVHLKDLLADPGTTRFLIFHLKPPIEGMREIPDATPCVQAFRERYGQPWYVSDRVVVFRFGPQSDVQG